MATYEVTISAFAWPERKYLVEASSSEDAEYEALDRLEREYPAEFETEAKRVNA
jgi:hypothetical protein